MKFDAIKRVGVKALSGLKKASPDICFWGGMALTAVGVVVLAVKSAKVDEIIEEHKSEIQETREQEEQMEPKQYRKEITKCYFRMGKDICGTYALPVTLLASGYFAMGFGHIKKVALLKEENALLMGSLAAAYKSIDGIRKQMVEELGEDKAEDIMNGIKEVKRVEVTKDEETGKETSREVTDRRFDSVTNNPAAITFEECTCSNAENDAWYNQQFLKQIEKEFQKILNIDKQPVFINDIYRRLGHRKTKYGQMNGYLPGDLIKLGFDNMTIPGCREFMAQDSAEVVLTFTGRDINGRRATFPHYILDDAF